MIDHDGFWTGRRQIVCVDFDGVIHEYTSKWSHTHVIPDPPVDGVIEWLYSTIQVYDVVIMSSRAVDGHAVIAMKEWLMEHTPSDLWDPAGAHGLIEVEITNTKPPARLYIDDRGYQFNGPGTFPTLDELAAFTPWNRRD